MEKRFIERVTHPQIAASTKTEIDLDNLRGNYGNDFNMISIINTDTASNIEVYLDGIKVKFITMNNGVFSFDWEFGLIYNFLSIENTNAGAAIAANLIKISVGRVGQG